MKTIAIGDIHGRTGWKDIVYKNDFDKVVIMGDYFDPYEKIDVPQQKKNFKEIVEFKRGNPDKVVLLFGNHDYHYLRTATKHYSRYQSAQSDKFSELLHGALDEGLLQICHIEDDKIFTHAGVTKTWCAKAFGEYAHLTSEEFEAAMNDLLFSWPGAFEFSMGVNMDHSGDDICHSPIWVRPRSLMRDRIEDYVQIIGHTQMNNLQITENVVLIDTLGTTGEYLQIVDGIMSAANSKKK